MKGLYLISSSVFLLIISLIQSILMINENGMINGLFYILAKTGLLPIYVLAWVLFVLSIALFITTKKNPN